MAGRAATRPPMDAETASARVLLDAWREQGADRLDPVRFGLMDALESRRQAHTGEARRMLDARLSRLLQDHAAAVAAAQRSSEVKAKSAAAEVTPAQASASTAMLVPAPVPATGTLRELAARLNRHRAAHVAQDPIATPGDTETGSGTVIPRESTAIGTAFAAPALLDEFRQLWDGVRGDSRLRQSREPAPVDAGPLNSTALAHRAIARMRQLSPDYARHFLAYVETLDWLERLPGAAPPSRKPNARRP